MKCPYCPKTGRGRKFKQHVAGHRAAKIRWSKRRAAIDPVAQVMGEVRRLRARANRDLREAQELAVMARRLKKILKRRRG